MTTDEKRIRAIKKGADVLNKLPIILRIPAIIMCGIVCIVYAISSAIIIGICDLIRICKGMTFRECFDETKACCEKAYETYEQFS